MIQLEGANKSSTQVKKWHLPRLEHMYILSRGLSDEVALARICPPLVVQKGNSTLVSNDSSVRDGIFL